MTVESPIFTQECFSTEWRCIHEIRALTGTVSLKNLPDGVYIMKLVTPGLEMSIPVLHAGE